MQEAGSTVLLDIGSAPTITVSARRYHFAVSGSSAQIERPSVNSPRDAVHIARGVIGSEITECIIVIMVDTRNRVMGYAEVCRGTFNAARLSTRDVLIPALLTNAAGVVLAHNHPSGDPTPSAADWTVTDSLRRGCELVGVTFVDHLIVTPVAHYSFASDSEVLRPAV